MQTDKKTLVIGASPNPERASWQLVSRLHRSGFPVVALGSREGNIEGVPIESEPQNIEDIHTVSLYINPTLQKNYEQYIIELEPQRVIFNPGTENREMEKILNDHGIETLNACSLVMLALNNY
jgi:uncharacterized protein